MTSLARARLLAPSREQVSWIIVGTLTTARVLLSLHRISLPGLQNDEVDFVNAATIRLPGMFIPHSIAGVPVMVYPYVGALKSWLSAPIFSIFGDSALTIRLAPVLIASAGLALLYPALRDLISRPVALLVFVALCFENSLFWLTRDDVGPNAIELFFKCAGLWCVARYARTRRVRWTVALLVTLALGTFNKLNFIWVVNAAVVASVLLVFIYRRELSSHRRAVAVWIAGLALIYACYAIYYVSNHIGRVNGPSDPFTVLPHTWPRYLYGIRAVLSGTWFYTYVYAWLPPRMLVVWAILGLFCVGALASLWPTRNVAVAIIAVVTSLMVAQTLLTYLATAGWHYISVYPYITIVAVYGAWTLAEAALRRLPAARIAAFALFAVLPLSYNAVLLAKYFRALNHEPGFSAWSPAIYPLSRYIDSTTGTVFAADWSILTPLFALHPSQRYIDLEYLLKYPVPANLRAVATQVADTSGPKLIVTHIANKLVFPGNDISLERALGPHLHLVRTIDGDDHTPVFLVYAYRSATGRAASLPIVPTRADRPLTGEKH